MRRKILIVAIVAAAAAAVFMLWLGVLNLGIFSQPHDRIPPNLSASIDEIEQALASQSNTLKIDLGIFADDKVHLYNIKRAAEQGSQSKSAAQQVLVRLAIALLAEVDRLETTAQMHISMIGLWRTDLKKMRLGLRHHELDKELQSLLEGSALTKVTIG